MEMTKERSWTVSSQNYYDYNISQTYTGFTPLVNIASLTWGSASVWWFESMTTFSPFATYSEIFLAFSPPRRMDWSRIIKGFRNSFPLRRRRKSFNNELCLFFRAPFVRISEPILPSHVRNIIYIIKLWKNQII